MKGEGFGVELYEERVLRRLVSLKPCNEPLSEVGESQAMVEPKEMEEAEVGESNTVVESREMEETEDIDVDSDVPPRRRPFEGGVGEDGGDEDGEQQPQQGTKNVTETDGWQWQAEHGSADICPDTGRGVLKGVGQV